MLARIHLFFNYNLRWSLIPRLKIQVLEEFQGTYCSLYANDEDRRSFRFYHFGDFASWHQSRLLCNRYDDSSYLT